jgi:L-ascorbate metabolism protein UlaG (beta-lactamase superfamily)
MKVKWNGHASFVITSAEGTKVITDPYEAGSYGGAIGYGKIPDEADIVLVSHDHEDHSHIAGLKGSPRVVKKSGNVKGIDFKGVEAFHDESQGRERGANTIFCFELDGIKVCHLGDLGHHLSPQQVEEIGAVDLLMIPVGGFFTIDARVATDVTKRLRPKVVIPMHYKTEKLGFPVDGVDEFLTNWKMVKRVDGSEIELNKDSLPSETEVIVLQHAL